MAAHPQTELSTAELLRQASEQTSRLVRQELALARVELSSKGRVAGLGAGLVGGATILFGCAVGTLVAAAILGLAQVLAGWLAALVVGAALATAAGVVALVGLVLLKRVVALPRNTMDSLRADIGALTAAMRDSRGKQ